MYRSASRKIRSSNYDELRNCRQTSDRYANELTASISQIEAVLKIKAGYSERSRLSSELSFNPFVYDNPGEN